MYDVQTGVTKNALRAERYAVLLIGGDRIGAGGGDVHTCFDKVGVSSGRYTIVKETMNRVEAAGAVSFQRGQKAFGGWLLMRIFFAGNCDQQERECQVAGQFFHKQVDFTGYNAIFVPGTLTKTLSMQAPGGKKEAAPGQGTASLLQRYGLDAKI